ncbi:hypothetical protein CKM354_001126800 [Cercospora kikuchii]|uniref:Uncharacterized protein n=1 Tax=Cercospora kikuchii TaxID=84275 RepID=A0A9P3FHX6_9PEZI|nr:uncharacterized protein CKM354_001126800 [Cercospora kikuchii]GIZ48198.1 hypothetical protein CKM354_001126800 [Cercospora kikuchii]
MCHLSRTVILFIAILTVSASNIDLAIGSVGAEVWFGRRSSTVLGPTRSLMANVTSTATLATSAPITSPCTVKSSSAPTVASQTQIVEVSSWNLTFHPDTLHASKGTILEFHIARPDVELHLLSSANSSRVFDFVPVPGQSYRAATYQVVDSNARVFHCVDTACGGTCPSTGLDPQRAKGDFLLNAAQNDNGAKSDTGLNTVWYARSGSTVTASRTVAAASGRASLAGTAMPNTNTSALQSAPLPSTLSQMGAAVERNALSPFRILVLLLSSYTACT